MENLEPFEKLETSAETVYRKITVSFMLVAQNC